MLSSMVKEHQTRQQLRREEQERRRKEALQASTNLTNALVDHLNVGVAQAYLNQKRLDGEARRLEQSAAVLQKQTQHWITLVNGFCSALKQVGDVASWTQAIHKDVSVVAATLHHAYTTTYTSTHSTPPPPTRAILPADSSGSGIGVHNTVRNTSQNDASGNSNLGAQKTPRNTSQSDSSGHGGSSTSASSPLSRTSVVSATEVSIPESKIDNKNNSKNSNDKLGTKGSDEAAKDKLGKTDRGKGEKSPVKQQKALPKK